MPTQLFNVTNVLTGAGVSRVSILAQGGFPNPTGDNIFSVELQNDGSPVRRERLTLEEGNNILAVPDGATIFCIFPPSDNDITILLRGASTDDGLGLRANAPSLFTLEEGITFIYLYVNEEVENVDIVWL